jgi:hypothetical protein
MSSYDRRRFLELLAAGAALPGPMMASPGQPAGLVRREWLGVGEPLQQRLRAAAIGAGSDLVETGGAWRSRFQPALVSTELLRYNVVLTVGSSHCPGRQISISLPPENIFGNRAVNL